MRAFLTAFLPLGRRKTGWETSALPFALAPVRGAPVGRGAAPEAPYRDAGQDQTIRHFIAMAQAARRPREF